MNQRNRADGRGNDRGVSEVLGAMLVFGLVLAVLALVQVSAVPAANQQIEYEHSQRVEGDFQELDRAIEAAATRGVRESTPLELGTRYPPRLFLLNPGPVSGDVRTDPAEVELSGFDAANNETRQYLNSTVPLAFETRNLSYRAGYNEYAGAPRVGYEGGVLYERYDADAGGEDIVVDRSAIVSGRRITVITLDGNLSTQQVNELSLDAVPVSAGTRSIGVRATSGASITVNTSLSEETWETDVLAAEYDPDGDRSDAYVSDIRCPGAAPTAPCNGELVIEFEPGTYDLRMAKVGLGNGFDEESPRYLTDVAGNDSSIVRGQTQHLTVQARDQYNNPVSGVEVPFSTTAGTFRSTGAGSASVVSDENGEASVVFRPTGTGPKTVQAGGVDLSGDGVDAADSVTFDVRVLPPADTGPTDPNAGAPDRLQDINTRTEEVVVESTEYEAQNVVSVTFRNTNATEDRFIREARIPFVMGTAEPDFATLSDAQDLSATATTTYGRLFVADRIKRLDTPIEVPAGGTTTVYYTFNTDLERSGEGNFDAFFVFSTNISDTNEMEQRFQTFFLSDGLGVDVFTNPSAGDVDPDESATRQTFEFTPNYRMEPGETVTIDLDDAQGGGDGAPAPVDYQGATVDTSGGGASTLRGGSASISATNSGATLTYTVGPSGLDPGNSNRVTINLEGVETQSSSTTVNGVTFTWSGASDFPETVGFAVG